MQPAPRYSRGALCSEYAPVTFGTKINRSPSSRLALAAYTGTSDLFRSAFQSSNSIGQFIIHDYMGIRAVALTTP